MCHHFSLKLPIFALIFAFLFEKYGKILNLDVIVAPKRHICAWDYA